MTFLGAGYTPKHFEFYDPNKMGKGDSAHDNVAEIIIDRFREAALYKNSNAVYQGKSTVALLREADYATEKRYSPAESEVLRQAFRNGPNGYYGLSSAKTTSIANWKSELVAGDPGALVQIVPTPDPRLPEAAVLRLREQVKKELVQRMVESGVTDPAVLMTPNGRGLHTIVKEFLDEKAEALRQIEKARVVAAASNTAKRVQNKIRDVVIEGGFREAYAGYSTNQIKYGVAIMRFPYWQRRMVYSDKQSGKGRPTRVEKTVPTFRNVSPWNFFVTPDAADVADVTACMEYKEVSKATLIGLAKDKRYKSDAILSVLDEYTDKPRSWMFPLAEVESENAEAPGRISVWAPEETVAVIYHEGTMSGADLEAYGETGYDPLKLYHVTAEVCCNRTIRCEIVDPKKALPRSYAVTKYEDLGPGVWNGVGVPGILHDSQTRLNRLYHVWEDNVQWAAMPPRLINKQALQNATDAAHIAPGGDYEINDMLGMGNVPDPIRPIRAVSAQYQMLLPLMRQIIQQADAEVGVPDLSDMSTFGRGSLGELSARVSQAVRRVRSAAFSEDRSMKAIWQVLFEYVLDENKGLIDEADLDMNYLGVVGLLSAEQEKRAKIERLQLTMQGIQSGLVPQQAGEFVMTDLLQDMGLPTDALGMQNPVTENAIAIATASGGGALSGGMGMNQVPQLDGRSGAMAGVQGAIAQPNGGGSMAAPLGPV